MLRRRLLRVGVTIGVVAAALLGMSPAANAAPSSFIAASIHGGGAGALAAEAIGGIAWYNRSVTLTSVRFYVAANECGYFTVEAWQGGSRLDYFDIPKQCAGSTGRWISYGDIPLDGSGLSGGITEVVIDVYDSTHLGHGWADCTRSASSCYTWPR
ncbi:hypothetical protein ACFY2R_01565 [Micromonospora olivasterospora]|uniref:Secreted protein n=1 Tax=Micromonospora olivasterospora TaxID=1880 RepID=A0A562ID33_MICOL|nr:hypothetical protein [Micromonospora olivasterospora]TWH68635.1 hypothetical protein JD77_03632 [Micromonospora olivasterospora]